MDPNLSNLPFCAELHTDSLSDVKCLFPIQVLISVVQRLIVNIKHQKIWQLYFQKIIVAAN